MERMKWIQWIAKSFVDACVIMSPVDISDTPQQCVVMPGDGLIDTGIVSVDMFTIMIPKWILFD